MAWCKGALFVGLFGEILSSRVKQVTEWLCGQSSANYSHVGIPVYQAKNREKSSKFVFFEPFFWQASM
jgi:hypothetical protein